jgi:hypothetical protein
MEKEETKPKTIADYPDIELKAMAYDRLVIIERSQIDLKAINEELARRVK